MAQRTELRPLSPSRGDLFRAWARPWRALFGFVGEFWFLGLGAWWFLFENPEPGAAGAEMADVGVGVAESTLTVLGTMTGLFMELWFVFFPGAVFLFLMLRGEV